MKFFTGLSIAALATAASAVSLNLNKRDSPLDVKLEMVGNTEVKASVTNTGASDLKLYKTGSFLDTAAVEKVEIYSAESRVGFEGVRLRTVTSGLTEDAFQAIAAGETVEVTFDVAQMHDLATGGAFDILSQGAIPYAEADSTELAGALSYVSNKLSATVNGAEAEKVRRGFTKRAALQSDCTSTRGTATRTALTNCRSLALAASSAAAGGSASKFSEYFKTTSSSTRSAVAATFSKVASECGSTTSGASDYYCTDVYGYCESNVLAYTIPSQAIMVNCPLYYSALPALTSSCHSQDQATTTLHEVTHLTQIKGTDDLGYGYSAATALSASQALNNADTYALYSNAIYAGC
ncbi:peptidase m35 deuterolysin [Neofusicoccum parvum]|uniref:Neutral protease 2 n=2 Tax=Neofusicoccum TaxID=407951 RepID=A0ABR3SUT9_9PEZI|nr:peptidase m35 deuterolysin [Neofusicoccum parvum]GME39320.1 peptidase m35 deuterolysin [Neofusicoccum parvum]